MRLLPRELHPAGVPARHRPVVERVACWSARHRKTAVAAWLAFMVAAFIAGQFAAGNGVQQYDPGQAGRGEQVLTKLGVVTPPAESVLIEARVGERHMAAAAARDVGHAAAEVKHATLQVEAALAALPQAADDIRAPYHPGARGLVAQHGTVALVTFNVAGPNAAADTTVLTDLAAVRKIQAAHPGLLVREAGDASTDRVASAVLGQDFRQSEWTSIPLTLILLLAVFGALIAAGIPVVLAGTAVVTAVSLLGILGRWLPVGSGTSELVLVIGMAVGVDYSLFYLRREREERMNGHSEQAVVGIAAATSGRAILVSGLTVMVSLAGLFLTGIDIFTGIGVGTIMVVGVAVLGSLFFLPALLSWLGPWADRGQLPYLGRRLTHPQPSRLWAGLARRVVRRPLVLGSIAAAALLALSAPALGMRIGNPSIDLPSNLGVVQVLSDIQHDFPAKPAPADVVVSGSHLDGPAMQAQLAALRAVASKGGAIHGPVGVAAVAHGTALVVEVPLAGNGSSKASDSALLTLENKILPSTIGKVPGTSFAVTGNTAASYDLRSMLDSRTPLVFGVVALLAFVLLMCAFRSVTIPVVSIVLNLLSVGGAYGLMTLIFQDGHLQGLLGFTSFGALVPWVPLFTFVMLFGLSMDYHVFILSRIRELWTGGASTTDAIVNGVGKSAGVVTSAAIIMVAVFSIFATLSMIDVKMLGVGLAAAVLIDATIVRGVVLPAALALLGRWAWYLPSWLSWLPGRSLACEGPPLQVPAPPVPSRLPVRPAAVTLLTR
ncbi:MAG TPA: MMPL family transporter [Streptosporangiaceae bacterium]|nr:MMPL family transporter [Streptosporangiaceae bacterium]